MAKQTNSSKLGRPELPMQFKVVKTPKAVAIAKAKTAPAAVPAVALKAKTELLKQMPDLTETVDALEIHSPADYTEADQILGMIQTARKDWNTRFYGGEAQGKTYDPIIPPLRTSLDALYALVREVDKPLEKLETTVKALQTTYKRAELEASRETVRVEQARKDQIERDRQAAQDALEAARTPRQRMAATAQLETLDAAAEEPEESIEAVQGEHSTTRTKRAWRHVDMKLTLAAIKAGLIPLDVLQLDTVKVNTYYKEDAATVESWPGFEWFEDITIVGRRGR